MLEETCRIKNIHALLVGMRFGPATGIISVVVAKEMSSNQASCASPGYTPKTLYFLLETWLSVVIDAQIVISKTWKNSRNPLTGEYIMKVLYIQHIIIQLLNSHY